MEEHQCVEEQDYSESINTEEHNSQNSQNYKIAEVTSDDRLRWFFCVWKCCKFI